MEKKVNKESKNLPKEMPHSLEAERALLGCLIMDVKIQLEVASGINENDFYQLSHQILFRNMVELINQNKAVDIVTLSDVLEKNGELEAVGGIDYITDLTDATPSSAGYKRYLDIVLRDSMLRKLIRGATDIIEESQKSTDRKMSLSFAEKTIFDISGMADTSEMVKIDSIIPDVMNIFDEVSKDKNALKGISTGYKYLDQILNGLHKSDLLVLAARPGVGKTSFAMNIVENVALAGKTCAVFSLEMGKSQLVERMMCSVAGVSMEHANKGQMTKIEWLKIAKAKELLSGAKIFIDDSSIITPQEIMSKCRRLKRKNGLDLVMVDYIQLMTPDKRKNLDNRQQEITEISRTLKLLAKEIDVPVLALSQLSRSVESRKGRPQLSDLRESGAIEQDADIVIFIHRPDRNATEKELAENKIERNVAEIIVEKHRNGPSGVVKLYFKGECTKFINYDEETGSIEGEEGEKEPVPVGEVIDEYKNGEQNNAERQSENEGTIDDKIF